MGNVNEKSLYEFKLIPGIAPTAQVVDLTHKTIEVTAYNPNNIMATSGGNNNLSFDPNEKEITVEDLFKSNTTVNANQEQSSGAFYDAEAERQWKERAAEINAQRRLEKKIETKIYKRLIKELLKKI
jgi:hypothetical protein